jgi:hypothetical protein
LARQRHAPHRPALAHRRYPCRVAYCSTHRSCRLTARALWRHPASTRRRSIGDLLAGDTPLLRASLLIASARADGPCHLSAHRGFSWKMALARGAGCWRVAHDSLLACLDDARRRDRTKAAPARPANRGAISSAVYSPYEPGLEEPIIDIEPTVVQTIGRSSTPYLPRRRTPSLSKDAGISHRLTYWSESRLWRSALLT